MAVEKEGGGQVGDSDVEKGVEDRKASSPLTDSHRQGIESASGHPMPDLLYHSEDTTIHISPYLSTSLQSS